tara:strand:- start:320 stop:787 length:468 start_codon:yes stop_codon:yes gene_type:complete
MVIKELQAGDEVPLIKLGFSMWGESEQFKRHPLNTHKLEQLAALIHTNDSMACFIAHNEEGYQGIWAGSVHPLWYSDDLVASDIVFYVKKKSRGSSAAVKLLLAAEKWAKNHNAKIFNIGLSSGIDTEKTICFFRKLNYCNQGTLMSKHIFEGLV